jgi:hypothetical protein
MLQFSISQITEHIAKTAPRIRERRLQDDGADFAAHRRDQCRNAGREIAMAPDEREHDRDDISQTNSKRKPRSPEAKLSFS